VQILKSWGKFVICYGFPAIVKHQPESVMNPCLKNPDLAATKTHHGFYDHSRSTNFITQQMYCRKVPLFYRKAPPTINGLFFAFAKLSMFFLRTKSPMAMRRSDPLMVLLILAVERLVAANRSFFGTWKISSASPAEIFRSINSINLRSKMEFPSR